MPRPRPQREPCDCLDCVERPERPPTSAAAAVARQEPPPKSLLVYVHGALAGEAGPQPADCPHVTALLRDGTAGLLAFTGSGAGAADAAAGLLGLGPEGAAQASLAQRWVPGRGAMRSREARG